MIVTLTIAGVNRWAAVAHQTLRVEDQLNARNVCDFTLLDTSGASRPIIGQAVILTMDGVRRFAGTVQSFKERNVTGRLAGMTRRYEVRCVDPNSFCDRHIHAEVYENQELADIVRDIATTHLYPDGVTVDPGLPDGPTIDSYSANYITVAQIFDELSDMTGYYWYIDYNYVLHFIDRSTLSAPYALNQNAPVDLVKSLDIEHTASQYRNFQYIRGGKAITDLQLTETMKGDGETKTFVTSLPVASVPTISTNIGSGFVARTVGIRQVDTGRDWYWQEDSNQISQDSSGTVLGATHVIRVVYYGYYPLIDAAKIHSEVEARQAVEGGSGLYEAIEQREDITSAEMSRLRAEGLLNLFGEIQTRVTFRTYATGWQAGQLLAIDRSEHGLSANFIIAEVLLEHDYLDAYIYEIRAVSGALVENWVSFFKRLAMQQVRNVRKPNEVINLLRLFYEDLTISESWATPTSPASVMGEVLANEVLEASSAEKNWVGFSLVGDLLQTINHLTRIDGLKIGTTEPTPFVYSRGQIGESPKFGFTESASVVVVTP